MLGGRQPIPHRGIEQTHQVMDFLPLVICGRNESFERKLHSVTIHVHPREKQISISFRNVRGGKQIPIYIVFKSQDFIDIFYQDISPNLKAFCGLRRERPSLADRQNFNISSTSAPDGVHHRVILGEHNGKGKDWSGRTDSYAEPHVDLRRYPPTPKRGLAVLYSPPPGQDHAFDSACSGDRIDCGDLSSAYIESAGTGSNHAF